MGRTRQVKEQQERGELSELGPLDQKGRTRNLGSTATATAGAGGTAIPPLLVTTDEPQPLALAQATTLGTPQSLIYYLPAVAWIPEISSSELHGKPSQDMRARICHNVL